MTPSCGACKFMDLVIVSDDEPESICRRFPPLDGWTTTRSDDWCGEFQEDERV